MYMCVGRGGGHDMGLVDSFVDNKGVSMLICTEAVCAYIYMNVNISI